MKKLIRSKSMLVPLLAISCAMFASFSADKGGEGYQIFLDGKKVVEQFGNRLNDVAQVTLNENMSASQLSVRYFHCGKVGTNRTLMIRDQNNKTLKEWHFAASTTASLSSTDPNMNCSISDILRLQKNAGATLGLYYASTELPSGRLLANLVLAKR